MKVPFTWKVTGWFMVGWSPEFRDEDGALHVLEGHCKQLGAHIAHGGWRYQTYVENPALSKTDAKGDTALRKWATQFYEVPV